MTGNGSSRDVGMNTRGCPDIRMEFMLFLDMNH